MIVLDLFMSFEHVLCVYSVQCTLHTIQCEWCLPNKSNRKQKKMMSSAVDVLCLPPPLRPSQSRNCCCKECQSIDMYRDIVCNSQLIRLPCCDCWLRSCMVAILLVDNAMNKQLLSWFNVKFCGDFSAMSSPPWLMPCAPNARAFISSIARFQHSVENVWNYWERVKNMNGKWGIWCRLVCVCAVNAIIVSIKLCPLTFWQRLWGIWICHSLQPQFNRKMRMSDELY